MEEAGIGEFEFYYFIGIFGVTNCEVGDKVRNYLCRKQMRGFKYEFFPRIFTTAATLFSLSSLAWLLCENKNELV